jgi:hypothetical protein
MIKLDYQETWYEKEERESFEKERSVAPSPNGVKPDCTSCDDKGCGFCVTGDSLAAHFPSE